MKTNSNRPLRLLSVSLGTFAITLLVLASTGCSTITSIVKSDDTQVLFNTALDLLQARLAEDVVSATNTSPVVAASTADDAVPYSSLVWAYGDFNGSKAPLDATVRIKSLTFSPSTLYYAWAAGGCEQLGATSAGDHNATICAAFFKGSDGVWRGGKFDWISSNRLSRGLEHCYGYNGWTLDGVPNPCDACFVIVSVKTGTRSNVIVGKWAR